MGSPSQCAEGGGFIVIIGLPLLELPQSPKTDP